MRHFYTLFCLFGFQFTFAQIITFQDSNFKAKLLSATTSNGIAKNSAGISIKIDQNSDGQIQYAEALSVYSLNLYFANLNSLGGIENFTNLNYLNCAYNNLTYLPLSNLTHLASLYCSNNQITSLSEIENLINLTILDVENNPLSALNVSNLSLLERLYCSGTKVTQLDICGTKIHSLWCISCPFLTSLKLKNNVISQAANYGNPGAPPPLFSFLFNNTPLLTSVCYDNGEYNAVLQGLDSWAVNAITFSTSCISCSPPSVLNLKLHVQGYYDASNNQMRPVKYNQDANSPYNEVETLDVELRNTSGNFIAATTAKLKTDGTAVCLFNNLVSGSYYIGVKSSNSVRTWSATPQLLGTTPLTYDFTNLATKAYGNNMVNLGGVYGLYSGDINQDGVIDGSDLPSLYNDIENSAYGIMSSDLNGDGAVDNSDLPYFFNNAANSVYSIEP